MVRSVLRIIVWLLVLTVTVAVFYLFPLGLPLVSAPTEKIENEAPSAEVMFVGDMFFDRYIRQVTETVGGDYVFSCISPLLTSADFVVGNLEGPITEHPSVAQGTTSKDEDHFTFTFPAGVADTLARNSISAVNLGNNHIGNFGREEMRATREHLDTAGVSHFGGLSGDEPVLRKEVEGVPLSFISYNQFGGDVPEKVAEKIAAEASLGRVVLVYAHWGDEYSTPTEKLRPVAELFAESGASAVIGSHPHIVLHHEYIDNTLVYYSLGNFIFDQYFNAEVSRGLAVMFFISSDPEKRISVTEYTTILTTDGRVCEAEPPS